MITSFTGKYRFLSNFYLCVVEHNGIEYISAEHAYQAAKSLSDIDKHIIWVQPTPAKAKQQGKRISIRNDWEQIKLQQMREILFAKFYSYPLRKALVDTADTFLIEGNTWNDTYWGQCPIGFGDNHLGKLLMETREYYRKRI